MAESYDPLISGFRASNVRMLPLVAEPYPWRDPRSLSPRPWLIGVRALIGYCTALVSPGGVGKTALGVALGLSVASGKHLLGDDYRVWVPGPVWLFNLEDGQDEIEKRVAAAAVHYGITADQCHPIYINSGRDRGLCIASFLEGGRSNDTITYPDEEALTEELKRRAVGLLIIDPFVSSHELIENDNGHMAKVMAAWARVARAANCAVVLVHHTRKGALGGDIDEGRGASAIANAARIGLTLARMSKEEAAKFGVAERSHWRYVRVDDAKVNVAPRAERASWFRLVSVDLDNGTETYPSGDSVQVAEAWQPRDLFDDVSSAEINAVLDVIAGGLPEGHLYSRTRHSPQRWAGRVLADAWGWEQPRIEDALGSWLRSGLLVEVEYRDRAEGKTRRGLRVEATRRPS
jgi:hypothetical protein